MIPMLDRIFKIKHCTRLITSWITLVCLSFSLILMLQGTLSASEDSTPSSEIIDAELVEGSWARTDGGYVLELSNIAGDGTLTAAYYNPRPINVFQAFWVTIDGTLRVSVELRDINYPGSKYNLQYDPGTDRLQGTYFQALEQQRYEIEFVRNR
jgi:hypothetical protein